MPMMTPSTTVRAPGGMVCSADQVATQAGLWALARGGNAVDAAIATNAAIAVTGAHMCGMGGDLFALIHDGSQVHALNASGRAGSGASSEQLRAEGLTEMPLRHDIRVVTVPGCVDGWVELNTRFGRLGLDEVLAPAIRLAEDGFPATAELVFVLSTLDDRGREAMHELVAQAVRPGALVRRVGMARALREVATGGRDAFYGGSFGAGLLDLGRGWFSSDDLATPGADWVAPLGADVWGRRLWTIPPNSQGYLTLSGALIAAGLELPDDTRDPRWAHLLIESATAAGFDRPTALHEGADGDALLAASRLDPRREAIDPQRASRRWTPVAPGDTTYLCTVDSDRMAVSLIQSNASNLGSWLVEPSTGINLHNRGLGFSIDDGHPAEIAPGRRPPHTLCPSMLTNPDGSFAATIGTMGGDAQPQIQLQVITRLLHNQQTPAQAIFSGRWALQGPDTGFDTWTAPRGPIVAVEGNAPDVWAAELTKMGHLVDQRQSFDSDFGHAHCIVAEASGLLAGAADPRTGAGSCAGL